MVEEKRTQIEHPKEKLPWATKSQKQEFSAPKIKNWQPKSR